MNSENWTDKLLVPKIPKEYTVELQFVKFNPQTSSYTIANIYFSDFLFVAHFVSLFLDLFL